MPAARALAVRFLTRRDYTIAELTGKLLERGCAADDVERAVDDLRRTGALDDRRVGAAHVRTASRIKGRGRLRVQRELAARGLDRVLIRELMADWPADDEAAAIDRLIARRLRRPSDPAERRRVFQMLLRRGFSGDAIGKAMHRLQRGDEDDSN